jgi:hypothetical protein
VRPCTFGKPVYGLDCVLILGPIINDLFKKMPRNLDLSFPSPCIIPSQIDCALQYYLDVSGNNAEARVHTYYFGSLVHLTSSRASFGCLLQIFEWWPGRPADGHLQEAASARVRVY